jgi:ABC-2 type transport system permease protein
MFRNVFLKTLRDQRTAVLAWGIALAALAYLQILFFPSIEGMSQLNDLLEQMPQLAGFLGDVASLTTIEGYITSQLLAFLPVVLAFYAILAATSNITGEIESGTIYYLLAHPVPRWRVAVEKFAAIVLSILIICLMFAMGLWLGALTIGESISVANLFLAALQIVPITLFYGAVAFALACVLRSRGLAIGIAAGLAVGGYIFSGLAPLVPELRPYREWTLFYLYSASKPLTGEINWGHTAILLALAAALVALGVYFFTRRDMLS